MPKKQNPELEIFEQQYESTRFTVTTDKQKELIQSLIESFEISSDTVAFFGTYAKNTIVIFTQYKNNAWVA